MEVEFEPNTFLKLATESSFEALYSMQTNEDSFLNISTHFH